jgi:hypothetical protein
VAPSALIGPPRGLGSTARIDGLDFDAIGPRATPEHLEPRQCDWNRCGMVAPLGRQ